jgi:hypothetical protein
MTNYGKNRATYFAARSRFCQEGILFRVYPKFGAGAPPSLAAEASEDAGVPRRTPKLKCTLLHPFVCAREEGIEF